MTGWPQSLCERCAWMRRIETPKGSTFLLCQLSSEDPRYAKYPAQPKLECSGYRAREST